ncbi:microfibrillar-associated protein MFAP1 [Moesziomyces antarcticus T-34]|uniref:Microfibrillar-associated protein MFAP1 n=1 Tax=Pseudozyma antarctica (strain T-34) TaxID=1151754 RepID=M9MES6_PSEA3|nr:microfibrillar-associated protein MFAP1 [Moesziomyces antarcticus T-34]
MAPATQPKAAAKVARPAARYRPGKAPTGAAGSLDDFSDSDNDEHADDHASRHTAAPTSVSISDLSSGSAVLQSSAQRRTAGIVIADPSSSAKKISVRLNAAAEPTGAPEQDDSSEYETDTSEDDSEPAQARPVFRKPGAPSQSAQKDELSEYETDSDDEGSEDEAAPPPLAKPIFVPKRARTTIAAGTADTEAAQEDAEAKAEEEAAKRRQEAHDLAAATIKRQLAEKEYQETHATDVDDTDGLDPEAEFEAWRQRELARLQRDREALDEKRKAQAELDAFRALPESEKERLGRERAKQQAAEKREQRGNPAFLQKYYHKGSFFQDMDILQRDYTEATSSQVDVSKLPKMMQVRNFGAKGRSKWTHLANEDTSKSAMKLDMASACFVCGGAHMKKDCPQRGGAERSGSNRADLGDGVDGSRTWGESAREAQSERRRSRSPRPERTRREEDGEEQSRSRRDQDHKSSSSHRDREHREHREHRSHRRDRSRERQDERDRDRRSRHRDDDQSRHDTERRERQRDDEADRQRRQRSDHEHREHRHRRERRDESDSQRRFKRHDDQHADDLHRKRSRHTSPPPAV